MTTNDEVIAQVAAVLAADPGVRWGYVFGSVARGGRYADVDVAIMPGPQFPPGAVAFGDLVARLEAATGLKVDLVDLQHAPLPFVGPMLTERRVVVDRDPRARRIFEAETTSRWLDFRPAFEEAERVRRAAMLRRLAGQR
ncbi:MAG: hypothetical protein IPK26_11690 [Planctomycetes bacterium]|nr:hypothetical protein [Planctomycetota bacterium]